MTGFEMLRAALAGRPITREEGPEVSVLSKVKLATPSPHPKLAVPRPSRAHNAQLNIRLSDSMMDAVQRWCYDNQYYLKDFVTEAIEAKLKTCG